MNFVTPTGRQTVYPRIISREMTHAYGAPVEMRISIFIYQ